MNTPLTQERIAYLRRRAYLSDLSGHNPSIQFVQGLDKFLHEEVRELLEVNAQLRARVAELEGQSASS